MKGHLVLPCLFLAGSCLAQNSSRQCETSRYDLKHRVFVSTDMSNEPDDQMSLVRFLTYANELDIQGIVGATSTHKNDSIDLDTIHEVISAYGNVTDNLNAHVPASAQYPPADEILAKVSSGHPVYGLAALDLNISDAAVALINSTDSSSDPTWFLAWGGANILAEALNHVSNTRSESEVDNFVSKLRVYTISDQDNAGPWIRRLYPKLFYIASIHAFSDYARATWSGISGEVIRPADKGGPDTSLVTNEWLDEHIRIGELGAHYPQFAYIMEGDTPSFFPLIKNGLGDPEHPEWGNWGGRYRTVDRSLQNSGVYSDATDYARGVDGEGHLSNHASIWRWRKGYQYDFANRMQWTLDGDYEQHNHAPVVIVNGTCGPDIVEYDFRVNNSITLDASESWDPDNDELSFDWFHYQDVVDGEGLPSLDSKLITIENVTLSGSVVSLTPTTNLVSFFSLLIGLNV